MREEKLLLPAQKLTVDSESNQTESKWVRQESVAGSTSCPNWPTEQLGKRSRFRLSPGQEVAPSRERLTERLEQTSQFVHLLVIFLCGDTRVAVGKSFVS